MKILVTGGCGFLGTNLSARAMERTGRVVVFDDLSRMGADRNLRWLREQGSPDFVEGDIRDPQAVAAVVARCQPDVVFHLAGQVAMTTSIANPRLDFEINALGTLNLLEAVRRHAPESAVLYSSTNKVYGDLEDVAVEETATRYVCPDHPRGFDESTPLEFHSPYGCSKGAADQYVLDYARIFGLKTAVFRHSSIYGSRQFSSYDQGWIGWFCQQAREVRKHPGRPPFEISGTGKQVRDVLFASDAVDCYFRAAEGIDDIQGQAFNIGGGMANSLSLLELFALLEEQTGTRLQYTRLPWRASDQRVFVADPGKIRKAIGWEPTTSAARGIQEMLRWLDAAEGGRA